MSGCTRGKWKQLAQRLSRLCSGTRHPPDHFGATKKTGNLTIPFPRLSASKVSFKPSQLGGGAWRAVYTKGPQPRWRIGSSGK